MLLANEVNETEPLLAIEAEKLGRSPPGTGVAGTLARNRRWSVTW